jgi:oxygen-independent coproporphyrinogen-3 oxidase
MDKALAGAAVTQENRSARPTCRSSSCNALRLREGFKLQDFCRKNRPAIHAIQLGLDEAERKGLIERDFVR